MATNETKEIINDIVMSSDSDEEDDTNDSCDCCSKGWDTPNEFGLCHCWCYKCWRSSSTCRYSCEKIKNKKTKIIEEMRKLHPNLSENGLLNISFRLGDKAHSQWTVDEECYLLPLLVSECRKPVASIVCQNLPKNYNVVIPDNCLSKKFRNRWGIEVLMIYHKDLEITDEKIECLANETLPYSEIGKLYGYI